MSETGRDYYTRVLNITYLSDKKENLEGCVVTLDGDTQAIILARREGNNFVISRNLAPGYSFGDDVSRIPQKLSEKHPNLIKRSLNYFARESSKKIIKRVEGKNPGCLVVIEEN